MHGGYSHIWAICGYSHMLVFVLISMRGSCRISFHFDFKTRWRMFLLLYSCHVQLVLLWRALTWHPYTKLYKFWWNTFPNNMQLNNYTDENLGKVVYISIILHIPASWLNLLNGCNFYFWWHDTANRPTYVLWGRVGLLRCILLIRVIFWQNSDCGKIQIMEEIQGPDCDLVANLFFTTELHVWQNSI